MICTFSLPDDAQELRRFILYRDKIQPEMERRRVVLESMYASTIGRPEIDPVMMMGISVLQIMERLPDRAAIIACRFDARWRMALGIPSDWPGIDPSSMTNFRKRLACSGNARLALDVALKAMRDDGYLKTRIPVRIDSTHLLGHVAEMSRLECARETLRLALAFLVAFGGKKRWKRWIERYAQRNPENLRHPTLARVRTALRQVGRDGRDVLAKAQTLGKEVREARPVALLRRVWAEQFEGRAETVRPRHAAAPGAVHNPHDPEAAWSTKKSLGKEGWVGYKAQVCETVVNGDRPKGEPTPAVITAVLLQPSITSDHGSIAPVLAQQTKQGQATPPTVHVDAGYISANQLAETASDGPEICGPMPAPPHSVSRFGSDEFDVNLPRRRARCPAGVLSSQCSFITEKAQSRSYYYFAWDRTCCATCALKPKCLSRRKRQPFRSLQVSEQHMLAQARRRKCRTPSYKKRMQRRNGIEGTISELKRGYGIRHVRYRGLIKNSLLLSLAATACNVRRWSARMAWLDRKKIK